MRHLKDYTLGEVQEICENRNHVCYRSIDDICVFCKVDRDDQTCRFHRGNGPLWIDLKEEKEFTNDQLAVMREFYRFGFRFAARGVQANPPIYICKNKPEEESFGWLVNGETFKLPKEMFPSIAYRELICFEDYIKYEEKEKSKIAVTSSNCALPSKNTAHMAENSKGSSKCATIKELDKLRVSGYRYIARDEDGELYVFTSEPEKIGCIWYSEHGILEVYEENTNEFKYIRWEDNDPKSIKDMLKNLHEDS